MKTKSKTYFFTTNSCTVFVAVSAPNEEEAKKKAKVALKKEHRGTKLASIYRFRGSQEIDLT